MRAKLGSIYLDMELDQGRIKKDFRSLQKQTEDVANRMKSSFKNIVGGLGIGLAAREIFQLSVEAKNAARDANETKNKFYEVFKTIEDEGTKAVKAVSKQFGLADSTSQELLSGVGDLLVGLGLTRSEALALSKDVVSLSSDVTSFKNVQGGVTRTTDALTKALLGEREMLKDTFRTAVLESEVMERANQIMRQKTDLTLQQAKAYATLQIVQERNKDAIGDFSRTQGDLANQERIAAEEVKKLYEMIGGKLIPAFTKATQGAADLASAVIEMDNSWTQWRENDSIGKTVDDIEEFIKNTPARTFKDWQDFFGLFTDGWDAARDALSDFLGLSSDDAIKTPKIDLHGLEFGSKEFTNNFIKKVDETAKAWSTVGKTIGEIEDRIKRLQENQKGMKLNSPELAKNVDELEKLSKLLDAIKPSKGLSANTELLEKQLEVYSQLYPVTEKWYNKSIDLIKAQTAELIESGIAKEDALKLEEKAVEKLNETYEKLKITIDKIPQLPTPGVPQKMSGAGSGNRPEVDNSGTEADAIISLVKGLDNGSEWKVFNTMQTSAEMAFGFVGGLFDDLYIKTDETTSAIEKAFAGMANAFIQQVQRMIAQWLALQAVMAVGKLFGIDLSFLTSPSAPSGKAIGGPVRKGVPYKVGEVGEELFVPDQNGVIIPNHKLGKNDFMVGASKSAVDSAAAVNNSFSNNFSFSDRGIINEVRTLSNKFDSLQYTIVGAMANQPPIDLKAYFDSEEVATKLESRRNKMKREGRDLNQF